MENRTPANYLDKIAIKKPTIYKGMTIFPLCLTAKEFEKSSEELETPDDHGLCKSVRIIETGRLETVRARNRGEQRTVLLEGATFIGGGQNRMLLASVILNNMEEIDLPVVGVENHRWDCVKTPSGNIYIKDPEFNRFSFAFGSLKRRKLIDSLHALEKKGDMKIDQKYLYSHINEYFAMAETTFTSRDMHALYRYWSVPLEDLTIRFKPRPLQIGVMTFFEKDIWFIDVFINENLFIKAYPSLLKSYSFDGLVRILKLKESLKLKKKPDRDDASDILSHIKMQKLNSFKLAGIPREGTFFFDSNYSAGTALVDNSNLIYLTACNKEISRRQY